VPVLGEPAANGSAHCPSTKDDEAHGGK